MFLYFLKEERNENDAAGVCGFELSLEGTSCSGHYLQRNYRSLVLAVRRPGQEPF